MATKKRSSRKSLQIGLALLLIFAGVVGLLVNSGAVAYRLPDLGRDMGRTFGEIGRGVGEFGHDIGRRTGEMGRDLGGRMSELGRDLGRTAGEFGRDAGDFANRVAQGIGSVFRTVLRLWPLALIGVGAFLVLKPKRSAHEIPSSQDVNFTAN
ncbi:MAG: hypothetical protein JXB47_12090 [Anaerolineae bacterium]|nr:hypothetical protein [Anaerolineae bacterium]